MYGCSNLILQNSQFEKKHFMKKYIYYRFELQYFDIMIGIPNYHCAVQTHSLKMPTSRFEPMTFDTINSPACLAMQTNVLVNLP